MDCVFLRTHSATGNMYINTTVSLTFIIATFTIVCQTVASIKLLTVFLCAQFLGQYVYKYYSFFNTYHRDIQNCISNR